MVNFACGDDNTGPVPKGPLWIPGELSKERRKGGGTNWEGIMLKQMRDDSSLDPGSTEDAEK